MNKATFQQFPNPMPLLVALVVTASSPALATELSKPADPALAAEETVKQARQLVRQENCDDAVRLLNRALDWAATHPEALALRADCLRSQQRLDDAQADYQRLVELDPDAVHGWFWLGTIDRWNGRHQEAIQSFTRVLGTAPEHSDALKGRARSRLALEKPLAAETDLRQVLRDHPRDNDAAILLAEAELAQGDVDSAREALRTAFTGYELQLELGNLEAAARRLGPAVDHYRRAAGDSGQQLEALRGLGDAERQRGRNQAALDALYSALTLEPDDIGTLYWIGVLETRAGRGDRALSAWESILALQPENVGALIGKARVLHYGGDTPEALKFINRALDESPQNGEALTLRATVFASAGRLREAGVDYEGVLEREPNNIDAKIGYDRYTDSSSWGVRGVSDTSRVVEGLDDEGAVVNGQSIRPTRIEYRTEGVEGYWRSHLGAVTDLDATISRRREAVSNLDTGFEIYDFDVLEASTGLDHHFGTGWEASWRVGGTRYEPKDSSSIREDDRLVGSVGLAWTGGRSRIAAEATHEPFIYRGFAGDTQFEIFDSRSLGASWTRRLSSTMRLESSASMADFSQQQEEFFGNLVVLWQHGPRQLAVGARAAPFPERFLKEDGTLGFLDSNSVYARFKSRLGSAFRFEADSEYSRIGAAPRLVKVDGELIDGPDKRNTRLFTRAGVRWSPRQLRRLSVGTQYLAERFDFRSGTYNTLDRDQTTVFVDFSGGDGSRFRYSARYGRSLVSDDRDSNYDRDDLYLRLEGEFGRSPAPGIRSLWIGLEGSLSRNTLVGATDSYEEERPFLRLYLKIPI